MDTRTLLIISAIVFVGGLGYYGHFAAALIAMLLHGLAWQLHVLEVKVNRLLDDRGIRVSSEELRR
jgi:hypothetical protein